MTTYDEVAPTLSDAISQTEFEADQVETSSRTTTEPQLTNSGVAAAYRQLLCLEQSGGLTRIAHRVGLRRRQVEMIYSEMQAAKRVLAKEQPTDDPIDEPLLDGKIG